MMMVVLHVADSIHADETPDNPDYQGHDNGELVNKKIVFRCSPMTDAELKVHHQCRLNECQGNCNVILVPDTHIQDEERNPHPDQEHQFAQRFR